MISGRSYIGSELSSLGTCIFKTFNSRANSDNPWDIHEVLKEDIDLAVNKAWIAFRDYKRKSDA